MNRKIFIGLAWPYANGSLHLGHASAFIGADVLARYHRLKGDDVLFVSGSDCYGTPIAVEATEQGIHPSEIADKYHKEFEKTLLEGLKFSCDIYTKTTTEHHTKVVQDLFLKLYEKGFLYTKVQEALYSPFLKRFLPDRYVEGICPKCKVDGARGDQCDECGSLLDPLELIEPRINSKILKRQKVISKSDLRLEKRESEHFYLKLTALQEKLERFFEEKSGPWRANAKGFAKSFLKHGLHDRAITRDTDWGVPIPIPGYEQKRIYVWFEAVCGYLSASKLWAEQNGLGDKWKEFWLNDGAIHYYVHGKDNIPFHTIIWPALLLAEGSLHTPDRIVSSQYLSLEGKQFSKSHSWAVWLPDFLVAFDSETLRYFLVTNGPETNDSDFSWQEFATKVNGELIGTFGNLVNRVLSPSFKTFPDGLSLKRKLDEGSLGLLTATEGAFAKVGGSIEGGKFRVAFREILDIAEQTNRLIDQKKPWKKLKDESKREDVETDLSLFIQVIRNLALLVNPFLPETSRKIFDFLGENIPLTWEYLKPVKAVKIQRVSALYRKVEQSDIDAQTVQLGKKSITSENQS